MPPIMLDEPEAPSIPDRGTEKVRSTAQVIVALVAACFALYFGREVLVPIAFALLFNALFRPVVRFLERLHLPTPIGAAVVVLTLCAGIGALAYFLSPPIKEWVRNAPERFEKAGEKLEKIAAPVKEVNNVATKLEQATSAGPTSQPAAAPLPAPAAPGAAAGLVGTTRQAVTAVVEVLLLLFLLLAAGDMFTRKLVKVMPLWRDKKAAEQVVDDSQRAVMRYMLVTAFINAGQAVVVGLVLWWLKMPSPLLWALLCFVLEFIPYMGATVMIALLSVIAFATFEDLGHILLVPTSYLVITTLQNNVVSPYLYGQHLKLNPVAVLVGVLLWWFLWGVPGAFIAVPIIATLKIIADRVDPLKTLGEFLGE
jgi:predicted PurR-regulated permease PerM